jgi:hypothetical protein
MEEFPHFEFDASSQRSFALPLHQTFTEGEWIAFHGTSSVFENDIDQNGIESPNMFNEREICDLVSIFQSMNWRGSSGASFGVLTAFTWSRTMELAIRPVYLSDYPEGCLLYLTKEFAGGETARAIRYAIHELSDYLTNDHVRQEHYNLQQSEYEDLASKSAKTTPVIKVNLDWLRAKLTDLERLRYEATSLEDQYQWGVVYAVRLSTIDLPRLADGNLQGLQYFGAIPTDRIAAKIRVSNMTQEIAFRWKNAAFASLGPKLYSSGLRAEVRNICRRPFPNGPVFNWFDRNNIDLQAGIDVSGDEAGQTLAES